MSVIYKTKVPKIIAGADNYAADVILKGAHDIEARAKEAAPWETGNLENSAYVEQTGPTTVEVGFGAEYGIYHELGTRKMAARPFLSPACMVVFPAIKQALAKVMEP